MEIGTTISRGSLSQNFSIEEAYDASSAESTGIKFHSLRKRGNTAGTAVPANPFRFSSEVYDSELDLVYYNYRHYSPSLGRFLSRDPIEEQGGLNLYAFCGNSPVLKTDFLGKIIPVLIGGVVISAAAYKCITGALLSMTIEATTQTAICMWKHHSKKCQDKCCKPNHCAFALSGIIGCLFAPFPIGGKFGIELIKQALKKFGGGMIAKALGKLGC